MLFHLSPFAPIMFPDSRLTQSSIPESSVKVVMMTNSKILVTKVQACDCVMQWKDQGPGVRQAECEFRLCLVLALGPWANHSLLQVSVSSLKK